MRIVVCVKQVPDVETERTIVQGRTERSADDVLNELDEHAVEAALVLVEEHGGRVSALTLGPEGAEHAVRRALQMGVDDGVHVCDEAAAGSDVVGTARILAAAVRRLEDDEPVDLVLTGMASLDGLTSMVPAALAAALDRPQLTLARSLRVEADRVEVERVLDDAVERLAADLPAVVSVTDQCNEPRFPAFKGIVAARKKSVTRWGLADLGLDPRDVGAAGAGTVVVEARPRPPRPAGIVLRDTDGAGRRLAEWLLENKLV